MSPGQIAEAIKNNVQLYAIQNIHTKVWIVDCFDYVRLYLTEQEALEDKKKYYLMPYTELDYEVKPWSYEDRMLRDDT